MKYIILVFFLIIIPYVIKEHMVFIGVVAVFTVLFILLNLLNSYVEKWKSSKKSKEENNSIKTRQEKSPSNVDIVSRAGYRFNVEKKRWECYFKNNVVAYIGKIKNGGGYNAGFLYDKYDMAAEDSFSTVLDAKKWVDTFYPVFTEGKIESYLNNGKFDSIITVRVNNDSSSNIETIPSIPLSTYTEDVINTDLPEQNNVCEDSKIFDNLINGKQLKDISDLPLYLSC